MRFQSHVDGAFCGQSSLNKSVSNRKHVIYPNQIKQHFVSLSFMCTPIIYVSTKDYKLQSIIYRPQSHFCHFGIVYRLYSISHKSQFLMKSQVNEKIGQFTPYPELIYMLIYMLLQMAQINASILAKCSEGNEQIEKQNMRIDVFLMNLPSMNFSSRKAFFAEPKILKFFH